MVGDGCWRGPGTVVGTEGTGNFWVSLGGRRLYCSGEQLRGCFHDEDWMPCDRDADGLQSLLKKMEQYVKLEYLDIRAEAPLLEELLGSLSDAEIRGGILSRNLVVTPSMSRQAMMDLMGARDTKQLQGLKRRTAPIEDVPRRRVQGPGMVRFQAKSGDTILGHEDLR